MAQVSGEKPRHWRRVRSREGTSQLQKIKGGWLWWSVAVIPVLWKHRQEEQEFKANLSYIRNSKPAWAT